MAQPPLPGRIAGRRQERYIVYNIGSFQIGQTMLHIAEELSRTAQEQVFFSQREAVVYLFHPFQALPRLVAAAFGHEDTIGLQIAAADAAPQLVELSQAKTFGAVDEHERRVGDVDADFDDTRRDQQLDVPFLEGFHDGFFLFTAHASVDEAARALFEDTGPQFLIEVCRGLQVDAFRSLDERTDDIALLALGHEFVHEDIDPSAQAFADGIGLDPFPPWRQFADG